MTANPAPTGAAGPAVRRAWGWVLADGVLGVIVGLLAVAVPGITLLALAVLLGIGLLVQGGFQFVAGLRAMPHTAGRGWSILFGAIAIVGGVICLTQPGAGLFAIALGVTIWFVAAGVNELVAATTLPEHRATNAVLGAINIVLGIVLISDPGIALSTAALLTGIFFVVRGVGEIALAMRLRSMTG